MSGVVLDLEVAELLRDSPDLLAVADAIAATQPRTRRRKMRYAVLTAAAALAVVVALVAPWHVHGTGFVSEALAALGSGEVIHVVSVAPLVGTEIVDLGSGAARPVESKTEVWFDGSQSVERVVSTVDGVTVSDVLQTPDGTWSDHGRVYTCAWIAAHPVEATKARVSCNPSGVNDATPKQIPEPAPTLDPALAGFVTDYRDALQTGAATRDGAGTVDGRDVEWLRFVSVDRGPPGAPDTTRIERVAVDTKTLVPIRLETTTDGVTRTAAIAAVETLDAQDAPFRRPQVSEQPVAASVTSQEAVSLSTAASALGGKLLSCGASVDGLAFTSATLQQIVTGYGESSGIERTHSTGVELVYGESKDAYVRVREALQAEMLYGFLSERPAPGEGELRVTRFDGAVPLWRGTLVKNGVYVAVDTTSRSLLLDAARQLEGA